MCKVLYSIPFNNFDSVPNCEKNIKEGWFEIRWTKMLCVWCECVSIFQQVISYPPPTPFSSLGSPYFPSCSHSHYIKT